MNMLIGDALAPMLVLAKNKTKTMRYLRIGILRVLSGKDIGSSKQLTKKQVSVIIDQIQGGKSDGLIRELSTTLKE
jgi:hypothetical protein